VMQVRRSFSLVPVIIFMRLAVVTETPFTDTQIELMRLIALGLSNTEISKRRFTTVKSTENSIARLAKILHLEQDETINQRVQIARTYFRLIKGI